MILEYIAPSANFLTFFDIAPQDTNGFLARLNIFLVHTLEKFKAIEFSLNGQIREFLGLKYAQAFRDNPVQLVVISHNLAYFTGEKMQILMCAVEYMLVAKLKNKKKGFFLIDSFGLYLLPVFKISLSLFVAFLDFGQNSLYYAQLTQPPVPMVSPCSRPN